MTSYTAADIAMIRDPERKRAGWWAMDIHCPACRNVFGRLEDDKCPWCGLHGKLDQFAYNANYTGPDFLHDDEACFRELRPVLLRAGMRIRETLGGCVIQYATPFGYDLVEDGTDGYAAATCAALVYIHSNDPSVLEVNK